MDYLSLWKLTIDGFFILAIAYLAYRLWQQSKHPVNLGALQELEASLRVLLKDSERSSAQLGEELSRKKRALEQLLYEVEGAEQRVQQGIQDADQIRRSLHGETLSHRQPERSLPPEQNNSYLDEPEIVRNEVESRVEPFHYPRVSRTKPINRTGDRAEVQRERESQPTKQAKGPVNIYGEPIASLAPEKEQKRSLAASIEKTVEEPNSDEQLTKSLEEIYASAEGMLRAGEKIESIAARTRLPLGEIQMLAQMVAQEESDQSDFIEQDSNRKEERSVGVLGGIQRNRQVL